MKAKVFTHGSNALESTLNEWLPTVVNPRIVCQFTACMHDLFCERPPEVCNQWCETTVYYEEGTE